MMQLRKEQLARVCVESTNLDRYTTYLHDGIELLETMDLSHYKTSEIEKHQAYIVGLLSSINDCHTRILISIQNLEIV